MDFSSNKFLKQACSCFAAFALLLCTFTCNEFAFALEQDCGAHHIELCSEHNNLHFVKTHITSSNDDSLTPTESTPTNSSHDSSHEIEVDNTCIAIIANQVTEQSSQAISVVPVNEFVFSSHYGDKYQYSSLDPPQANTPLSFLKTVRLLI